MVIVLVMGLVEALLLLIFLDVFYDNRVVIWPVAGADTPSSRRDIVQARSFFGFEVHLLNKSIKGPLSFHLVKSGFCFNGDTRINFMKD